MSRIFLFPGQGSQKKGMGADVFPKFPEETATADAILGYSVAQQCIEDPGDKLSQTEYTQPLLFTVCALTYLDRVRETGASRTWSRVTASASLPRCLPRACSTSRPDCGWCRSVVS